MKNSIYGRGIAKPIYLTILFVITLQSSLHAGCDSCKSMIECDYYVARNGDTSRRESCLEYARNIDIDGASGRASWYYLLGGDTKKALESADRAIKTGQHYAGEYAVMALLIEGEREKADRYLSKYGNAIGYGGALDKDIPSMKRLYPGVDFSPLIQR